ncbi:MAG: hypothetical protein NUV63_05505 [Gallionella sp.]|nr:hypothetical protein [Gallionella sp.]
MLRAWRENVVCPLLLSLLFVAEQFFAERKLYAPAIDWSSKATSGSLFADDDARKKPKVKTTLRPSSGQDWLSDFLGINPPPSLTESTGLNVTTPKTKEAKQPFVERRQRVSVAPDGTKLTNER